MIRPPHLWLGRKWVSICRGFYSYCRAFYLDCISGGGNKLGRKNCCRFTVLLERLTCHSWGETTGLYCLVLYLFQIHDISTLRYTIKFFFNFFSICCSWYHFIIILTDKASTRSTRMSFLYQRWMTDEEFQIEIIHIENLFIRHTMKRPEDWSWPEDGGGIG